MAKDNTWKPDEIQGNELSQWSLYDRHLQLQENGCAPSLKSLPDVHWCGTLRQFEHRHNMYHYNSCLHDQQEPIHHQNSAYNSILQSPQ